MAPTSAPPPPAPLIDAQAVAGVLGCSPRTARRLAQTGVLPAVRVGGDWRYDPEAVAEALAAATAQRTGEAS